MLDPKNLKSGEEQYEYFKSHNKQYIQYDYRDYNGNLYSCVTANLEKARLLRDEWLRSTCQEADESEQDFEP